MTDHSATKTDEFVWPEGWSSKKMYPQRRFHYYRDGQSLCGKWSISPEVLKQITLKVPPDPHSVMYTNHLDCNPCRRKMRATATPTESGTTP